MLSNKIKACLVKNKWAILILIFIVALMLSRISNTYRCVVVDVVGYATKDTDTGTLLFAIFEKKGINRRFVIPKKTEVKKGLTTIIEKENDFWNTLSYEYDLFSTCKDK